MKNDKDLHQLKILVEDLNKSNSVNEKLEVLKSLSDSNTIKLLEFIYNPYKQYYLTWKNIQKRSDLVGEFDGDIFKLLTMLNDRDITGHDAIKAVNGYLKNLSKEYNETFSLIFNRNLKARVDTPLINRALGKIIPTFNVALANKYENFAKKMDFNERWYWSRKLDGVRVICRVEDGDIKFFSRAGKEFYTLGKIKDAILELRHPKNCVLDGELCIVDENGNENFQSVIKEIRRKDHTIENPRFKVFDMLTLEEFDDMEGTRPLKERLEDINWMFGNWLWKGSYPIDIVDQRDEIDCVEDIVSWLDSASDAGWEGIMLRKDAPYQGKRSNDILKVKKMNDFETEVLGYDVGPFRIINKDTHKQETIDTLRNVFIEYKGNKVSVGSGFSLAERQKYFKNPDLIVGKQITCQYFEESQDQNGNYSLRFPVVKAVWEEGKRNI